MSISSSEIGHLSQNSWKPVLLASGTEHKWQNSDIYPKMETLFSIQLYTSGKRDSKHSSLFFVYKLRMRYIKELFY